MRDLILIAGLCALLALASFGCLLWAILRGQILGLDDLLLILVCLTLGGIFSLNLAWLILKTPLRDALGASLKPLLKRLPRRGRPAEAPESTQPGAPPSP